MRFALFLSATLSTLAAAALLPASSVMAGGIEFGPTDQAPKAKPQKKKAQPAPDAGALAGEAAAPA